MSIKVTLATDEVIELDELIAILRRKNRGGLPGWLSNDRADALEALDQVLAHINASRPYLQVLRTEMGSGTLFADPALSVSELEALVAIDTLSMHPAKEDHDLGGAFDSLSTALDHTRRPNGENLIEENARLKKWIADLQSGTYITCVYCGHQYGPKDTTPIAMADVLKEHIKQCKHHPMSKLSAKNAGLRFHLRKAIRFLKTWPTSESSSELDEMGGPDSLYAFIRHVESRKLTEPDHE